MKRFVHTMAAAGIAALTTAQWSVPTKVILDSSDPQQRQVTGLALPQTGAQGASASADRSHSTIYAVASGSDALSIALTPALSVYTPGLRITFTPSATNMGDATLNIDGLGAVPLRKNVNAPLDSADLRPGVPVSVIHDGVVFQVINQFYPGCPAGYRPIGRDACVEDSSHAMVNWYQANGFCISHGARLCGFQEWLQACFHYADFLSTVSDYEWVDSAANGTNTAKTMGIIEGTTTPDCRSGGHKLPTETSRFRCCYDR